MPAATTKPLKVSPQIIRCQRCSFNSLFSEHERVPVSIGSLHTVTVARKTLPFQLFYDIGGNLEVAQVRIRNPPLAYCTGDSGSLVACVALLQISFSPSYVYSLNGKQLNVLCCVRGIDSRPLLLSDVMRAAGRLIPPIPSLYPIAPLTQGHDAESVQPVSPHIES